MNCNDFKTCLANGNPLPDAAADHLRKCLACQAMMSALRTPEELPDAQRLDQLAKRLAATATPVRPLPSDSKMILIALAIFAAFTFVATLPFGFEGLHRLSMLQKACYYALLALVAIFLSAATVKEMIPGSRKAIPPLWSAAGSLLLLAVTVLALFREFDLNNFTRVGIPCLRLGLACAAVSGLLASWFFRKGYPAAPIQGGLAIGAFAGLSGVAVLALHCPVLNAPHILVWHLGAMLISGLVGAALGSLIHEGGKPAGKALKANS